MKGYSEIDSLISEGVNVISRNGINMLLNQTSLSKDTLKYICESVVFLIDEKEKYYKDVDKSSNNREL